MMGYDPNDAIPIERAVSMGIEALYAVERAERAAFTPAEPPQQETKVSRAPTTEAETVADPRADLSGVSAPPPSANDYQVSLVGAPDFDLKDFAGGVERIERRGELLVFQFSNGGQLCVPGAVTYHTPERH